MEIVDGTFSIGNQFSEKSFGNLVELEMTIDQARFSISAGDSQPMILSDLLNESEPLMIDNSKIN